MVVGTRTRDRSGYFVMADLARDRVQRTRSFLAVYDAELDTGYIYRIEGDAPEVQPENGGTYLVGDQSYRPDALPLESLVSIEAFFFAWNAFYPNGESVGGR